MSSAPELPGPGGSIPKTFPTPWAARAFAITLGLHEKGLFSWSEWAETLGAALRREQAAHADEEGYWQAWISALASLLEAKGVAGPETISTVEEVWRAAAEATPHGEPVTLHRAGAASLHPSGGKRRPS